MSSLFTPGQGFFVRVPSWHQLEKVVLEDWPGTWEEARGHAGLLWEPESVPIYEMEPVSGALTYFTKTNVVPGYQRIIRNDNRLTLGIQSQAYRMVTNTEFGYVIESLMGQGVDSERLAYEGVFELDEGRMVVAVVRLTTPIIIPGDNSETYTYVVFMTRHDGRGGLRVILTNVRVVCANTAKMAEAGAKDEETAFTIRHMGNWDERVAEVRDKLADALQANDVYAELCTALALKKVTPNTIEKMTKKLLPIGDDMGVLQQRNRENERYMLKTLIEGPTVPDEHRRTPYGWLQAATEWSDHYRPHRTESSYVTRQLVSKEPFKVKAFTIAKTFAGVR
jgi:phage/plasmid-like protein (TIGR03299 family)